MHNIHSLFVNWCRLSVESRALTCPFTQSNPSVSSLLSWHPTHILLWLRLSVLEKLFVSTITVPPSDSDYVNRSTSLQHFRAIHTACILRVCVSLTNPLFFLSLSLLRQMHKYTGGCREQRRGNHGRGGEGARKECCIWKGYFVSGWSVTGALTPRDYITIHLGQSRWSAESRKDSLRLQVGWVQVSTRICWWLVNSVIPT